MCGKFNKSAEAGTVVVSVLTSQQQCFVFKCPAWSSSDLLYPPYVCVASLWVLWSPLTVRFNCLCINMPHVWRGREHGKHGAAERRHPDMIAVSVLPC